MIDRGSIEKKLQKTRWKNGNQYTGDKLGKNERWELDVFVPQIFISFMIRPSKAHYISRMSWRMRIQNHVLILTPFSNQKQRFSKRKL